MAQKAEQPKGMVWCASCGQSVSADKRCREPVGCENRGYDADLPVAQRVARPVEIEFEH